GQEVGGGRGVLGLAVEHSYDVLAGESGDTEIAVVTPQPFEDAPILALRRRGEVGEIARAEIADDHGADRTGARSRSGDLDARGVGERFPGGGHELVPAGKAGHGHRLVDGAEQVMAR